MLTVRDIPKEYGEMIRRVKVEIKFCNHRSLLLNNLLSTQGTQQVIDVHFPMYIEALLLWTLQFCREVAASQKEGS